MIRTGDAVARVRNKTHVGGDLLEIYHRLRALRGHRGWWPGETPFEVAVGAVLVQNTAWTNVEKVIAALKAESIFDPGRLRALPVDALASRLRPVGYFRVKERRLRALLDFLDREAAGDPGNLAARAPDVLRKELLAVHGIGRETADSILLYALGIPVFVIDAYTRRFLGRMGRLDPRADYEHLRRHFQSNLPSDAPLFNDFHAQIVQHAKESCRTRPLCEGCLFRNECPRRGVEPFPARRKGRT
jgi:endonuclease-3 related protein